MNDRALDPVAPELVALEQQRPRFLARRDSLRSVEATSESCAEPISFAESKRLAELEITRGGLVGKGSGVKIASVLGIDKSTLFGKRDPRAMNRGFTAKEIAKLARYADWVAGNREFSRSA